MMVGRLIQQLTTQQQWEHQRDKQLRTVTAFHDSLRSEQDQQQGINQLLSKQLSDTQHSLQLRKLHCKHLETELASWGSTGQDQRLVTQAVSQPREY